MSHKHRLQYKVTIHTNDATIKTRMMQMIADNKHWSSAVLDDNVYNGILVHFLYYFLKGVT